MPWMIIYAFRGLVLNHNQTVRAFHGARFGQILEHRGLSGTFNVIGQPTHPRLVAFLVSLGWVAKP